MPDSSVLDFAVDTARQAGALALRHFRDIDALTIESKGHQDLVSNADRDTETLIRSAIAARFPEDGIFGEEHGSHAGTSGHVWVIDPIDGTANFVRGIPQWCVSIARCTNGIPDIGVVFEPSSGEMFAGRRGSGATVNGRPMRIADVADFRDGSVGTGFSARFEASNIVPVIATLLSEGGVFFRNASGALMLAYVAAGRLIGYIEEHMNSWDCMAGLLLIEEAGGHILAPDAGRVIQHGAQVVAAGPSLYPALMEIAESAYGPSGGRSAPGVP